MQAVRLSTTRSEEFRFELPPLPCRAESQELFADDYWGGRFVIAMPTCVCATAANGRDCRNRPARFRWPARSSAAAGSRTSTNERRRPIGDPVLDAAFVERE